MPHIDRIVCSYYYVNYSCVPISVFVTLEHGAQISRLDSISVATSCINDSIATSCVNDTVSQQ